MTKETKHNEEKDRKSSELAEESVSEESPQEDLPPKESEGDSKRSQEIEEEKLSEELYEEEIKSGGSEKWFLVGIIVVMLIAIFGVFGEMLGAGWFFYRKALYSSGELYALNLGEKPLWISVDGRAELEVKPEDARIVPLVGGESIVEVRESKGGKIIESYPIFTDHSDALLKLSKDGCLVAVNLDPYYGHRQGKAPEEIEFTDKLNKNDQVWVPGSYNVVWPRKTFPPRLTAGAGPGRWIELVACTLLGDTSDDRKFLDAYIALRLQERMKKALNPPKPSGPVRNKL